MVGVWGSERSGKHACYLKSAAASVKATDAAIAAKTPDELRAKLGGSAFSLLAGVHRAMGETRKSIQYWTVASGLLKRAKQSRSTVSTHNKVFRNLASAYYDIGDVVHGKAAMRCSNMLLASVVPHAALDAAIVSACSQRSRDASESSA